MTHSSDIDVTRALVFIKQAIAILEFMENNELELVAAEIEQYLKYADDEHTRALPFITQFIRAYKEIE